MNENALAEDRMEQALLRRILADIRVVKRLFVLTIVLLICGLAIMWVKMGAINQVSILPLFDPKPIEEIARMQEEAEREIAEARKEENEHVYWTTEVRSRGGR